MVGSRTVLLLVAGILLSLPPRAIAAEGPQRQDLIREIVAAWQARQADVKTLTCSAKVESFYPAGYLTDRQLADFHKRGKANNPPTDKRYAAHVSWAIDFAAQRVKKESDLTTPHFYAGGSDCELAPDPCIHLLTNGKYQLLRPSGYQPTAKSLEAGGLDPNAVLYGERSQEFLLNVTDLPLLWLAGGINGQWPAPRMMQHLEDPERFMYRGEAQSKGHRCVVLTLPEQNGDTGVREFWVGPEKPYPIYYCRARDGDWVFWQLEVDYRIEEGGLVPTAWTATGYNQPPGKLFDKEIFTVQQIAINSPLRSDLFEKSLEPGMLVFDVEKNAPMQVNPGGRLVPLGTTSETGLVTKILFWATLALLTITCVLFALRWFRKRRALP